MMAIQSVLRSTAAKTVENDTSNHLIAENLFSPFRADAINDTPLTEIEVEALAGLFIQTIKTLEESPGCFEATIGALETDSPKEKISKAFLFALNLKDVKLERLDDISPDQALHAMKAQAEHLKKDRIGIWETLAYYNGAPYPEIEFIQTGSAIEVGEAFLKNLKGFKDNLNTVDGKRSSFLYPSIKILLSTIWSKQLDFS